MTEKTVAIVYSRGADPRPGPEASSAAHVVRGEIPVLEDILRQRGFIVLSVAVGDNVLDDIRGLSLQKPDLVINLCEDLGGDSLREMHFASALELAGLSYTGSPPMALGLCLDKGRTKSLVRQHGIPTPDFFTSRSSDINAGSLSYPLMVKPSLEDGSLGIDASSVAGDEPGLRRKATALLSTYREIMVEEYIDGRELNVAIIGPEPLRVLPVSEIDFSTLPSHLPRITCYDAKWTEGSGEHLGTAPRCPAAIEGDILERVTVFSKTVFRVLDMRDYGRIDWRLSEIRGPQFLEANPNPDISPESGFVRSLRCAGLDYEDLVDALLRSAVMRRATAAPAGKGEGDKP